VFYRSHIPPCSACRCHRHPLRQSPLIGVLSSPSQTNPSFSDCEGQHQDIVLLNWAIARMLFRSLRCFSSTTHVLKPGDVLKKTRVFTEEDVLQYSKVSHDSNPLHNHSEAARSVGFEGPLVHGMLVASLFPHIISSHFVSTMLMLSLKFKFSYPCYKLYDQQFSKLMWMKQTHFKCLLVSCSKSLSYMIHYFWKNHPLI